MEVNQIKGSGGSKGGKGGKSGKSGKEQAKGKAGKDTKQSKGGEGKQQGSQFQGECGFCGWWGNKRADCRTRLAAQGGSTNQASADGQGAGDSVQQVAATEAGEPWVFAAQPKLAEG